MSMKRSVYGCLGLLALGASAIALIVVSRSDLETIAAVEQTANDTTQLTAAEGTSIAAITSVSMSDQVVAVPSWQRLAAASDASLPAIGWTYERERLRLAGGPLELPPFRWRISWPRLSSMTTPPIA
jgi:hypothetical protein